MDEPPASDGNVTPCTSRELLPDFLRLGTFGFGGPIALVGYMQRDLVEQRRWISHKDYVEGLAQLAPGPLAAQLAFARRSYVALRARSGPTVRGRPRGSVALSSLDPGLSPDALSRLAP
jgi:hypothetical protein